MKTITLNKKKAFFKFALDVFTDKIKGKYCGADLNSLGFCNLHDYFFGDYSYNFELIPELNKYKPKKHFYDYRNEKTIEREQFWFPIGDDNKKRIAICEKILTKLG